MRGREDGENWEVVKVEEGREIGSMKTSGKWNGKVKVRHD